MKKSFTETVTLKAMQQQGETSYAIEWALQQRGDYPVSPQRPRLQIKHTSLEAKQYSIDLQIWEKTKQDYDEKLAVWKSNENAIIDVIIAFIKEEAALDTIPKQYQEKVYNKAYEYGHSSGYYEVYLKLLSLIEIFR